MKSRIIFVSDVVINLVLPFGGHLKYVPTANGEITERGEIAEGYGRSDN